MKTTIISTAFAILAAVAQTAPAPAPAQTIKDRQFQATITFIGVDPSDSYTLLFPTNGQSINIYNTKSVSKISSVGGAVCSFFGIDGSETVVVGEEEVDVGPPQTQIRGVCDEL